MSVLFASISIFSSGYLWIEGIPIEEIFLDNNNLVIVPF
jgi:hypothetical protein